VVGRAEKSTMMRMMFMLPLGETSSSPPAPTSLPPGLLDQRARMSRSTHHELVAAAPQVHLVDDTVSAPTSRRGRDDQVQGVAALDPHVEPEPGRNLDTQLRQSSIPAENLVHVMRPGDIR
jgi:hypothetical protein